VSVGVPLIPAEISVGLVEIAPEPVLLELARIGPPCAVAQKPVAEVAGSCLALKRKIDATSVTARPMGTGFRRDHLDIS
jgi:hypothetical protein